MKKELSFDMEPRENGSFYIQEKSGGGRCATIHEIEMWNEILRLRDIIAKGEGNNEMVQGVQNG